DPSSASLPGAAAAPTHQRRRPVHRQATLGSRESRIRDGGTSICGEDTWSIHAPKTTGVRHLIDCGRGSTAVPATAHQHECTLHALQNSQI
uniref:Uncharacterized protein n=1 Tax=Aegilops tauschii subsp. strangulata TaxID=200361 RepID=A0A452ZEP5_AEGTS